MCLISVIALENENKTKIHGKGGSSLLATCATKSVVVVDLFHDWRRVHDGVVTGINFVFRPISWPRSH